MNEVHQGAQGPEDFSLGDAWNWVREARLWITLFALLGVGIGATYSYLAPSWYRAEVVVLPAASRSAPAIGGQLGGLASLAGLSIASTSNSEPIAVIRSADFIRDFIEVNQLMPVLFADRWDNASKSWRNQWFSSLPDWRDGVRLFEREVRSVREDKKTSVIVVAVEWKDPVIAAKWANGMVDSLNEKMRRRALADAEQNVAFLRQELASTSVVALQQSVGRLLESEMQKLMLARGNREFSFRVIDRATPPKWRARPNTARAVALGFVLGTLVGLLAPIYRRGRWARASSAV